MAIKKMSSQEYNKILEDANDKIKNTSKVIAGIKKDIEKKMLISSHEFSYLNNKLKNIEYKNSKDNNYVLLAENSKGLFETYCNVVHPSFKKEPINIFNLRSVNSDIPYFRDEVKVKINDIENDYYKSILKDEKNPTKEIHFEELVSVNEVLLNEVTKEYEKINKDSIKIEIEVDKDRVIGSSKFNIIELDPYLYGSFDISMIEIFGEDFTKPLTIIKNIESVGKTRILLDTKYLFKKVTFHIEPNYRVKKDDEVIIPFGFKHIFFLDADFRNDSYITLKFNSDKYIDHIKNDMKITTPLGEFETTIKEQGIKIYLENVNGILQTEQEVTENIKKPIARNLKTVYFKAPIGRSLDEEDGYSKSIIAYNFKIEYR